METEKVTLLVMMMEMSTALLTVRLKGTRLVMWTGRQLEILTVTQLAKWKELLWERRRVIWLAKVTARRLVIQMVIVSGISMESSLVKTRVNESGVQMAM